MSLSAVAPTGPLQGMRVVELAGAGPSAFAGMMLADLGADVIRVERPGGIHTAVAGRHDLVGRGRRSVVVDLKHPEGVGVVLDLVGSADILIEGYRPGVAEKLGLGPDACLKRNPRLVYGRITGWGRGGPLSESAGHDINFMSITGTLDAIGAHDGPPVVPLNLVGELGGGAMYLVTGVLAALVEAGRSGRGQVIDAAIVDGVNHLMTSIWSLRHAGLWNHERGTNVLDGSAPYYGVYKTSDDRYMSVGAFEPPFYAALLDGLELTGWAPDRNDRAQWPALRECLAERFASKTQQEWRDVFDGTDACVAPVLTMYEAATHPHNIARGTFIAHRGAIQPSPSPRFSGTPAGTTRDPEDAGSSTREALEAWGITDVDRLISRSAVTQLD